MYLNFYRCKHCGQIIAYVDHYGLPVTCCNEDMDLLTANDVDASVEKHVPVLDVEYKDCCGKAKVKVGEEPHPSVQDHYIEWIAIETNKGMQLRKLKPGEKPEVTFHLCPKEKVIEVYAYCNKHSLWKAKQK